MIIIGCFHIVGRGFQKRKKNNSFQSSNSWASGSTETSLMNAARSGRSEEVPELLFRSALIKEIIDMRGNTALLMSVLSTRIDVLRVLVRSAADVDQANKDRVTPLIIAAKRSNPAIVSILPDSKADLRLR